MREQLPGALALINNIVQAAIVIFGVSVVLYNLRHSFRERVTRAFNSLLFFVVIVYFVELVATRATLPLSKEFWVRLEWIGISMVPAAQFHLSDALLVTTGDISARRRVFVRVWYLTGVAFFTLVLATDVIVTELIPVVHAPHLSTGLLFPLFVLYFWSIAATSVYYVWRARERCVTQTTRKRMTVILITFLAAPLAVFPYLTFSIEASQNISIFFWLVVIIGNITVSLMFAFLTYYISYFGATSPDRVVRVRLFKYMARVPLAATIVLLVYIGVGRFNKAVLGLQAETALALAVVGSIILIEWAIYAFKRPLERLSQLTDEPEVRRIQQLSERVVTTRDMRQFLESVLAASCEVLRTPTAFVASFTPGGPRLEAVVGSLSDDRENLDDREWQELAITATGGSDREFNLETIGNFILWRNYWIRPLHSRDEKIMVGIMGVKSRAATPDLNEVEEESFTRLISLASSALEDRRLQLEVFAAVEGLLPQVTALQRRRSAATFGGTPILTAPAGAELALVNDPEFSSMVWDALSHYWGGPKLTESPLLRLRIVQDTVDEMGGNPTKALREILDRAVEQQKPEGERSLTTTEWILYNILELKFIQGQKVRDVARRLAMSESDLYRKQRVAIENVARTISRMEQDALVDEDTRVSLEDGAA